MLRLFNTFVLLLLQRLLNLFEFREDFQSGSDDGEGMRRKGTRAGQNFLGYLCAMLGRLTFQNAHVFAGRTTAGTRSEFHSRARRARREHDLLGSAE